MAEQPIELSLVVWDASRLPQLAKKSEWVHELRQGKLSNIKESSDAKPVDQMPNPTAQPEEMNGHEVEDKL
ncbi:hypothetical protein Nepgr_013584 [Nepenthes gracilis]|uniref:Uncharacterized protein n=1 Tax=Nepenthes gracilis TaxID=150966 RepID=A0AAD3XP50_NEPGR|nr:hypothetical protein Nepgr_013584 [Nepenthes gracilis]